MSRLLMALLAAAFLSPASGSSRAQLRVHIIDYAAVSNIEVSRAESEAARLWNSIDVALTWSPGESARRGAASDTSARALDVTALLLNQDMAQRMIAQEHRGPGVLARAVPEAMRVYVFYDRVKLEGERYPDPRGVILGRVVAHELAHLFLGHTHSKSGLFRAQPDLGSAREAFALEDAEKIRAEIFTLLANRN